MATKPVSYEVQYRRAGTTEPWQGYAVPVAASLSITKGLQRGETYTVRVRALDAAGASSDWAVSTVYVPATNRLGALALPGNYGINQSGMWDVDTSVTYAASATEEGVATATISMSAGTFILAGSRIEYGPSSATIDGTAGEKVTVYLYLFDPKREGGSKQLQLTTNYIETADTDGKVAVTALEITFPAAGSSGTGGGGIGGGGGSGGAGACPSVDAWVIERARGLIRAGQVLVDDWLLGCDGIYRHVTHSQRRTGPGVRIVTAQQHALTCSTTAPILTDRGFVSAPDVVGRRVMVNDTTPELLASVLHIGDIEVQHITLAGVEDIDHVFLVGDEPGFLFPHHNMKQVDTGL